MKKWEIYDNQDVSQYTHVMAGLVTEPITDIKAQVAEFRRRFGKNIDIIVFTKDSVEVE